MDNPNPSYIAMAASACEQGNTSPLENRLIEAVERTRESGPLSQKIRTAKVGLLPPGLKDCQALSS